LINFPTGTNAHHHAKPTNAVVYTVSQQNDIVPTLVNFSFDKHRLILTISGKWHQHTFENDVPIQFPLPYSFTYFICF